MESRVGVSRAGGRGCQPLLKHTQRCLFWLLFINVNCVHGVLQHRHKNQVSAPKSLTMIKRAFQVLLGEIHYGPICRVERNLPQFSTIISTPTTVSTILQAIYSNSLQFVLPMSREMHLHWVVDLQNHRNG